MFNEKIVSDLAEKLGMPEVLEQFRSPETPAAGVNPLAEKLTPLQVFSQADFDTRITNEKQMAAQEATRTATGNTYGAIDKRIKEITGLDKNADEAKDSLAYAERAFREKFGTKGNETDEVKQLRADLQAKNQLLQTKETELETMKATHATEAKQNRINSGLDAAINALAINAEPQYLDAHRRLVKNELMAAYEADVVEGKTVFKDKKTGKEMRNATTADLMTEAELVAQFAPTVVSIKSTSQKRGPGVSSDPQNTNSDTEDLAAFATIEDYKKALLADGVVLASSDGQEKIAKYLEFRKAQK